MLKPHVLSYSIKIFHSTMHLENRISLKYAAFANIDIFHHMMPDKSPLISLESLSQVPGSNQAHMHILSLVVTDTGFPKR